MNRDLKTEQKSRSDLVGGTARPTNGIREAGSGAAGMGGGVSWGDSRCLCSNWERTTAPS